MDTNLFVFGNEGGKVTVVCLMIDLSPVAVLHSDSFVVSIVITNL